jgi:hypothetical protein
VVKPTMGIRNVNLRRSQVTKIGKFRMTAGFSFFSVFALSKYPFRKYLFFYLLPLQLNSQKTILR